jgi:hypothetical protein
MALRAGDDAISKPIVKDPPASLIVNNGTTSWQIRISDDALPVGVVKFYPDGDDEAKPITIQVKDATYALGPKAKVKMVICGSALEPGNPILKAAFGNVPANITEKVKNKIIGLYLSLDKLDAKGNVQEKSASRYHFVHGVMADAPKVPAASMLLKLAAFNLPDLVTKLLDKALAPVSKAQKGLRPLNKDTWDTTPEGKATITTVVENYQTAENGAFWTIEK